MEESVRATSNALVVLPLCAMFVIVLMCVHRPSRRRRFSAMPPAGLLHSV